MIGVSISKTAGEIKMSFFREWTASVVGIIIFTSACEIIVPDGEMKKYVRLVLGMLVTISLIKPIGNFKIIKRAEDVFYYDRSAAFKQQEYYSENERKMINDLYRKKLEEKIVKTLNGKIDAVFTAVVDTEAESGESFGEIKDIYIEVKQSGGFRDYADEIKEILKNDFGIKENAVRLKFVGG